MPKVSTSYKPGQSGNLNGRPKKEWTWRGLIVEAMEEIEAEGKPIKKHVAKALASKALQGDVQAIKEIGNRIDGMPKQSTDITSGGEKLPIPILQGIIDVHSNNSSKKVEQTK